MAFLSAGVVGCTTRHSQHALKPRMCVRANGATTSAHSNEKRAELWRKVEDMRRSLELAVKRERYSDAARLRDEIEELSLTDEWVRVRRQLDTAVAEERYTDAARWRDMLASLEPPPGEKREAVSESITQNITVRVQAFYMPGQSKPNDNELLFGYKVRIENSSNHIVQLVSRHWIISTPDKPDQHVRGPGVVGKQPVMEPGDFFEYTSACPVKTSGDVKPDDVVGWMSGEYSFCRSKASSDEDGVEFEEFDVRIQPFYFLAPSV